MKTGLRTALAAVILAVVLISLSIHFYRRWDASVIHVSGKTIPVSERYVDLSNRDHLSLVPLKRLASVQALNLGQCNIPDLSELQGLDTLNELYLNDNKIKDISPLSELRALTTLDIRGNQVVDLAPLAEMGAMSILNLSGNPIHDLTPLSSHARSLEA